MESDAHDARMAKEREEEDAAKAKAAKGV